MNWKLVLVGGIVFFVVQWILYFITGPIVHESILADLYRENAVFWRPELNQEPPDMAALMPYWLTTGLITAFILAGVYGWLRPAFSGAGWMRGAKYGLVLFLVTATMAMGWAGVFNLPNQIWIWWTLEGLVYFVVAGAALGWVAEKVAPLHGSHGPADLRGADLR